MKFRRLSLDSFMRAASNGIFLIGQRQPKLTAEQIFAGAEQMAWFKLMSNNSKIKFAKAMMSALGNQKEPMGFMTYEPLIEDAMNEYFKAETMQVEYEVIRRRALDICYGVIEEIAEMEPAVITEKARIFREWQNAQPQPEARPDQILA